MGRESERHQGVSAGPWPFGDSLFAEARPKHGDLT